MKKVLKGMPASPGKAKGKVRIVLDPKECKYFQKGEVLVTEMTDPLYVHAMAKANGIITEIGGILCHAAITAREFKIPCLVSVKNATKILKNGQLVTIDVEKGEISLE